MVEFNTLNTQYIVLCFKPSVGNDAKAMSNNVIRRRETVFICFINAGSFVHQSMQQWVLQQQWLIKLLLSSL